MWLRRVRQRRTYEIMKLGPWSYVAKRAPLEALAAILVLTGGAAVLARFSEAWLDPQSLSLFFVVPIVVGAIVYGFRASLAAALLSTVAINFLFVAPRYSLSVARGQDAAALLLFALVAVMVSIIAERARTAELARVNAARESIKIDLLASVSHDLRTPLATIVLTLQSLRKFGEGHAPDTRDELLRLAEGEAERLARLVDTLLDASRIEAGAAPVHLQNVSIADIVAAALEETKREAGQTAISTNIPVDLPSVRADPVLSVRALANILSNALTHAPGAPVLLRASEAGDCVVLTVSDRGPGLGPDPERLFAKFERGVEGDGRRPGLGLGLSLARSLLESQGASITARSDLDAGATFDLRFPLAAAHGD